MRAPRAAWLRALQRARLGRLLVDRPGRAVYATDASVFRVVPSAVLQPAGPEQLRIALELAADAGVPVTARGAGSSRAGQALGAGLVVDLSAGFNQILDVDPDARRARVQPGVVLADLQRALAPHGLFFAPDPSSGAFCTLGGMLGNNAGGPRSLRFGSMRAHLHAATALLAGGRSLRFGPGPLPAGPLTEVAELLDREAETLRAARRPPAKNSSGYDLAGLPPAGAAPPFDPVRLLCGSEGTLAVATELELRLCELPRRRATVVLRLNDLRELQAAVLALRPCGPSKIELVDRALLELASPAVDGLGPTLERSFAFLVLVEAWEPGDDELASRLDTLLAALGGRSAAEVVRGHEAQERLWALRAAAVGYLARHPGPARPLPILEDPCVGPERLSELLGGLRALLERLSLRAFFFGHAGDGNLHVNALVDPRDPDHRRRARELLVQGHRLVADLGGSLSGEHGDGRLRTPFLPEIFGAVHERLHRPLKALFDPGHLLNPGVIVSPPDPELRAPLLEDGRHGDRADAAAPPPAPRGAGAPAGRAG